MKVAPQYAGMKLDLFLRESDPALSRKQAKRLLDAGRVRVNGRKVIIASWELQQGDVVEIVDTDEPSVEAGEFYLNVVFEDEALIVVDKPAGIACEASPLALKPSLVQIINAYLKRSGPPSARPYLGLMHRLDKETSGLIVYTKKKEANKLSDQFKRHVVHRVYRAVVAGRIEAGEGVIRERLIKEDMPGGVKMRVARKGEGVRAETHYRVLERYANATQVELTPRTGRTHQLRVHLASLGHPILGDRVYGSRQLEPIKVKRQALHAALLGFRHPMSGEKLSFTSDLPRELRRLVDQLRMRG